MSTYTDANGVPFTDADVERWADEAEAGFPDSTLTRETPAWVKTEPIETHSVRVPARLWQLIKDQAEARGMCTSEYTREARTRSLLPPLTHHM
ncbi:CopG family transcriptional regulator [Brevibacterium litoralis]|uniref:CopG family transcriptional regulator n=1 Tax=Brevibacterium litoralis TaxID=3138935 RepID=UPI0032EC2EE4